MRISRASRCSALMPSLRGSSLVLQAPLICFFSRSTFSCIVTCSAWNSLSGGRCRDAPGMWKGPFVLAISAMRRSWALKKDFHGSFSPSVLDSIVSRSPPLYPAEPSTGPGMAGFPRTSLVVHYAEIGTKGNNRAFFENQLERNLLEKLEPLGKFKVELVDQRLLVSKHDDPEAWRGAMAVLKEVFGVAWLAKVVECPLDYEGVRKAAVDEMACSKETSSPPRSGSPRSGRTRATSSLPSRWPSSWART